MCSEAKLGLHMDVTTNKKLRKVMKDTKKRYVVWIRSLTESRAYMIDGERRTVDE